MTSKTVIATLLAVATLSGTAQAAEPGLYYATGSAIGYSRIDGSGASTVAAIPTTAGIAIDGDTLFFARTMFPGTIGRVDTDGTALDANLITGLLRPFQLAVSGPKLYWTDYGAETIGRANLDGSAPEPALISVPGASPTGIAVAGAHVYWTSGASGARHIGRADVDGSGADATWLDTGVHPGPLTTDGTYLYWTDAGGLSRARLDGSGLDLDFAPGLADGMSLTIGGGFAFASALGIARIGLDGTGLDPAFLLSGTFVNGIAAVSPAAAAPVRDSVETASGTATKLAIRNTGGAPLCVAAATVTGAGAGDFAVALGTCAAPVAAGDSCELEVTFSPRDGAAGTRAASVEVTFADGVAPVAIAVSGAFIPAPVPPDQPIAPTSPTAPAPVLAPEACRSGRTLSFHLRKPARGTRYTRVDVLFAGKRVKRITRPARVFTVNLSGRPKGSATVRITTTDTRGRTKTRTRTFRTCTPGR